MSDNVGEDALDPTIFDETGEAEWVFVGPHPTEDGWLVSSLDVATYRPLSLGDRLIALDRHGPDRFVVQVVEVTNVGGVETFYNLRHLADVDPSAEVFGRPSWGNL